jgi:hypothetical protein
VCVSALLITLGPPSGKATPRVARPVSGHYLGASPSGAGPRAEFLRLDDDGTGAYRVALRWVAICEWKLGANDRFTFRTAQHYGMVYTFNGALAADTIRGHLTLLDGDGTRQRWTIDATFQPLDTTDGTREVLGVPGGIYSELKYLEDAGDVVGVELFIGTMRGRLNIALGQIQGSIFDLLMAHDIERSGDTVRFRTAALPSSEMSWRAVFKDGEVALFDPVSWAEVAGRLVRAPRWLSIPRVASLGAFFREEALGTCPR